MKGNITSNQVKKHIPNPTGKGGFKDNPQNRSDGRWRAEDSISYQYHKLLPMKVEEFKKWLKENPEDRRTMAQELAYNATLKARNDLAYLKEVSDRTEGKSTQKTELSGIDGSGIEVVIRDYSE